MEGRGPASGNSVRQNAPRTQGRDQGASNALERVRQAARKDRGTRFTALFHHIAHVDVLRDEYQAMNRRASAGADGVTWEQYGRDLEANLRDLVDRLHRGAYRAKPSRRTYIPKADGRLRPLGIAALEDKLVQGATSRVLCAIYEEDFYGFSYGFRPGRGVHDALDALTTGLKRKKVNWVLDADIRGYFDAIDHGWLMTFVRRRIADPRVLRLIQKWLAAGVMEDEKWRPTEEGTPQGATISPILANVYLHHVLDRWIERWRRKRAQGDVVVVRYADDFILGFESREDAERCLDRLRRRMARFGLELHPDKTRLIEFGRYADRDRRQRGQGRPESFTFLGMRHICGHSLSGNFQVLRHTDRKRMRTKLSAVRTELTRRMHHSVTAQGAWLRQVVGGYLRHHAVPTNFKTLAVFRRQVGRLWKRVLARRSQRGAVTWERLAQRIELWLPRPKILHPWPEVRFDRLHPGARAQCGKPARWDPCGGSL